jgi:hypothetical protein
MPEAPEATASAAASTSATAPYSEIAYNDALGGHGFADGLGIGGGVYNLGTFLVDAATVFAHNHASTSNDDCFGC